MSTARPSKADVMGARGLVLNALVYSGTNVVAQLVALVAGFVLRRLLSLEAMGFWELARVLRSYLQPITLGASKGAERELPILFAAADREEETACRSVTLISALAEALVISLALFTYLGLSGGGLDPQVRLTWVAVGFMVPLLRLEEVYTPFFQGAHRYVPLSRVLLIGSVVYALALPAGAALGGLVGVCTGAVAGVAFRGTWIAFVAQREGVRVRWLWRGDVFKRLVSYGIGIKLANYPNTFFMSFDLLWVGRFMAPGDLAVYGLVKSFYTQGSEITTRIGTVALTRTLGQFGAASERQRIVGDLWRFLRFQQLVSLPLVAWVVASAAPGLIRLVLPDYGVGIPVIPVLLAGMFFTMQNTNLTAAWIAEKKVAAMGATNVAGAALVILSIPAAVWISPEGGLQTVAGGMTLGLVLYYGVLCATVGREMWGGGRAGGAFLQGLGAATYTCLVLLWAAGLRTTAGPLGDEVIYAAGRSLLTLVALTPLVALGIRGIGGLRFLRRVIGSDTPGS